MNCNVTINSSIFEFQTGCKVNIRELQLINDSFQLINQGHSLKIKLKNITIFLFETGYAKIYGAVSHEEANEAQKACIGILNTTSKSARLKQVNLLSISSTFSISSIIEKFEKPKFVNFHKLLLDISKQEENNHVLVSPNTNPSIQLWINKDKKDDIVKVTTGPTAYIKFHHTGESIIETANLCILHDTIKWLHRQFGYNPSINISTKDRHKTPKDESNKLICDICQHSSFNNTYSLKRHKSSCKGKKPGSFICTRKHNKCRKYYSSQYNLDRHLGKYNKNLSSDKHECQYWSKYKTTLDNLTNHIHQGHMIRCNYCITNFWEVICSVRQLLTKFTDESIASLQKEDHFLNKTPIYHGANNISESNLHSSESTQYPKNSMEDYYAQNETDNITLSSSCSNSSSLSTTTANKFDELVLEALKTPNNRLKKVNDWLDNEEQQNKHVWYNMPAVDINEGQKCTIKNKDIRSSSEKHLHSVKISGLKKKIGLTSVKIKSPLHFDESNWEYNARKSYEETQLKGIKKIGK